MEPIIIGGTVSIALIGFVFFVRSSNVSSYEMERSCGMWAICSFAILFVMLVAGCANFFKQCEEIDASRNLSEYTIYLDGKEIDSDKIDLSLYAVHYDDENKKVYATHRTATSSGGDGLLYGVIGYQLGAMSK